MMVPKLASVSRAWCLAAVLLFSAALAADQKSPLLGLSRDQLVEQLGEPKSQLAAGNRVVMIFARERVVLRDGVVVEVEMLPPEAAPRRPAPPEPDATAAPAATAEPVAPGTPPPASTSPRPSARTPADAPEPDPGLQAGATKNAAEPAEPVFSIKQVRPPGTPAPKSATKQVAIAPSSQPGSPAATPSTTSPAKTGESPAPLPTNAPTPVQSTRSAAPTASTTVARNDTIVPTVPAPSITAPAPTDAPAVEPAPADKPEEPAVVANAQKKGKKSPRYTSEPDILEPEDVVFSPRTYIITFMVVGFGLGFLLWQRRQRQLELAATAVSRTPFPTSAPASQAAPFPASLLNDLEWKRFEELVASYYNKTGVVAERTKAGPQAPVQIKISWKGEPRPFACVQCIAHPKGLIDAAPIQELFNVLTAEDIRRGYVVTTGKFNVAARDFAEEKHITLMSGDIFLEKINALPGSARTELVQEFSTGDYRTPTCPKCDTKMVHSPEDPAVWVCKNHPDVKIPSWE